MLLFIMNTNSDKYKIFSESISTRRGNMLRWGIFSVLLTTAVILLAGAIGMTAYVFTESYNPALDAMIPLLLTLGAAYIGIMALLTASMKRSRINARHWDIETLWGNMIRWIAVIALAALTLATLYGVGLLGHSIIKELFSYRIDWPEVMFETFALQLLLAVTMFVAWACAEAASGKYR